MAEITVAHTTPTRSGPSGQSNRMRHPVTRRSTTGTARPPTTETAQDLGAHGRRRGAGLEPEPKDADEVIAPRRRQLLVRHGDGAQIERAEVVDERPLHPELARAGGRRNGQLVTPVQAEA